MSAKYAVVTMAQIAKCKTHNLSPRHWIPEHKLEECDPDCKAETKAALEAHVEKAKAARADFEAQEKAEREYVITAIRHKHIRQKP